MKSIYMFKWKNVILLTILLLIGLGGRTLTASAQTALIDFDVINVRSGPGNSYDIIGSLNNSTSVTVIEHSRGWIKLSCGDLTGYVPETLTDLSPSLVQIPPTQVYINDKLSYDIDPISINGCTLVPLGTILDNLGAAYNCDADTQTVTARKSGITIKMTIGSPTANINGEDIDLDVPVQIVNGRTFVPLRFLVEAWECETTWDGDNRKIYVYSSSMCTEDITGLAANISKQRTGDIINTLAISITATDVHVRSCPSTAASVIGLVPNGTKLAYEGEQDGWYQVNYQGQSAWVAGWLASCPTATELYIGMEEPALLPVPSTHQGFVLQMKPYAETASNGTGLPVNFLLAQWAEESGFGTSSIARYYNNFGGIKDPKTGGYKRYLTPEDFAQDVINLYTQHSNYNRLLADARAGASIQTLLNDLNSCHYASSSSYGQKIKNSYLPEIDKALANIQ